MIKQDRARELMAGFGEGRILVVGDLMLDRYVTGQVSRISPEAPVPVVCVTDEYSRPGGAANVAKNIVSFGGNVQMAGVVGSDGDGDDLEGMLSAVGVDTGGVVRSKVDRTTVKTRVLADRQQIVRVDRERENGADEKAEDELCNILPEMVKSASGVIVEDYGKGIITQKLLDVVIDAATAAGVPVGMDPKYGHDLRVGGIKLATPNYKEACSAAGLGVVDLSDEVKSRASVVRAGELLLDSWNAEILLVTLGSKGMCLISGGSEPEFIPTRAREVFDVSGAGDTVISAAMLALTAGASDYEAASIANYAAGVVVAKVGTATCTQEELLASIGQGGG